jgi:hypothetical protein
MLQSSWHFFKSATVTRTFRTSERQVYPSKPAKISFKPQASMITKWQARFPGYRLVDSLMKQYGRNILALMPTSYLQDVLRVWFA